MKEGIHPNYREICFMDMSNGFKFVTRSCASTKEKITMEDGRELPLYKLDTTSESHPSSSTVTPLAATRCPMRPLNALEPLRLKSPSKP